MNLKEGDKVSVLNDTISGHVLRVDSEQIVILDTDGFERIYHSDELVKQIFMADFEVPEDQLSLLEEKGDVYNSKTPHLLVDSDNAIDLHIENLTDEYGKLTNFEIVSLQMEACKRFVRKAIDKRIKKITIIHGKGEGVLRSEVHSFLDALCREHEINLSYEDGARNVEQIGGATKVVFFYQ